MVRCGTVVLGHGRAFVRNISDKTCSKSKHILRAITFFRKIVPFMEKCRKTL